MSNRRLAVVAPIADIKKSFNQVSGLDEGAALDVRSGHETARMLKTASPTLARKSDNDFHGALRAFRTMLGFELAKLGF